MRVQNNCERIVKAGIGDARKLRHANFQGTCVTSGPCMMVIPRSARSLMSTTLFQVMVEGSMSSLQNFFFSSSVSSDGSVLVMPSFFNLVN